MRLLSFSHTVCQSLLLFLLQDHGRDTLSTQGNYCQIQICIVTLTLNTVEMCMILPFYTLMLLFILCGTLFCGPIKRIISQLRAQEAVFSINNCRLRDGLSPTLWHCCHL